MCTSCVTLNFNFKGQRHNIETYFFEFPDIDLVLMDTKHRFLRYILPEILYWMRYVMFDLEIQSQRSRSQYWHIYFWIPRHRSSTYRHQNKCLRYILQEISYWMRCYVWPQISKSKVKVTTLVYMFSEFRDLDSVLIDTTHKFLRYILPEISYWMCYVMFDLEFQDQISRSQP